MNHLSQDLPRCLICGYECEMALTGLYDNRFGAPGTYDIVQCRHCGLEQTWPRPTAEELNDIYECFYNWGVERDTTYINGRERFFASSLYRLWLKKDGDICFHLRQGHGQLLDIGCNEGRGLTFYARNGFHAEGLEINKKAAAAAREKGFTVYNMPVEQFVPEKAYDVVVLSHVLEHAPDPMSMLTKARSLLRPQGQVWISCPNAASRWRGVFGRHWVNWHVPYHLWHFSPRSLTVLLNRAQFQLAEMQTCTPAIWIAQSLCAAIGSRGKGINRWLRSAPMIGGLMLAARGLLLPFLGHPNGDNTGDCLIVTAIPRPETGHGLPI